jgi:hypothetical protein
LKLIPLPVKINTLAKLAVMDNLIWCSPSERIADAVDSIQCNLLVADLEKLIAPGIVFVTSAGKDAHTANIEVLFG